MWIYETLHNGVKLALQAKQLCRKKTQYQDCRIYETSAFGKALFLDGVIQTTEADEFIYHEMLTHPPLLSHPQPKSILLIGAGDGGVLREVLKHPIKKVTLVEIDADVIKFSKQYLNFLNKNAFADRRLKIIIDDGAKFAVRTKEKFDLALIDSPDPIGPAKILFSKKFYQNIFSLLTTNGLMIRQTGSTMLQRYVLKENYRIVKKIFPYLAVQVVSVPTYIGGFFSFLIGSKKINPEKLSHQAVLRRYNKLKLKTKYYNPDIHFASLKLPNYLQEVVR